jgi:hypothetical protein
MKRTVRSFLQLAYGGDINGLAASETVTMMLIISTDPLIPECREAAQNSIRVAKTEAMLASGSIGIVKLMEMKRI